MRESVLLCYPSLLKKGFDAVLADCPAFKAALDDTLDRLGSTHRDARTSLFTLRFQTLLLASNSTA